MKPLQNVTEKDAIEIIKAGYPSFFRRGKWELKDISPDIKEPCMQLFSKAKAYTFSFYSDSIDIDVNNDDSPVEFDSLNFDTNYKCYIKAVELGYYVPILSEFLAKNAYPIIG